MIIIWGLNSQLEMCFGFLLYFNFDNSLYRNLKIKINLKCDFKMKI